MDRYILRWLEKNEMKPSQEPPEGFIVGYGDSSGSEFYDYIEKRGNNPSRLIPAKITPKVGLLGIRGVSEELFSVFVRSLNRVKRNIH